MADAPAEDLSFYPSWHVRLIVRLEEYAEDGRLQKYVRQQKITNTLRGVKDDRATLQAVKRSVNGVVQYVVVPAGSDPNEAPGGPQARADDQTTFDLPGIQPISFNLGLNGIRQADTMKLTLRFADLPIDPRVVRACGIVFYLGTLDDDEAGRSFEGGEGPLLVGETSRGGRSNRRFVGWVDRWTAIWPETGEATVELDCRDNTTLMIDQDAPPKLTISGIDPIDKAIATYLTHFPQMAGLAVEYRPVGESDVPAVGQSLSATAFQPNLGPVASKGGTGVSKLSVWDYITDVCAAIGHSVYVDGTTLIVQRVQTMTSNRAARRPDDPFQGREVEGERLDVRRVIYGHNLDQLRIGRQFSKSAPTNVEVRCYDPGRKNVLVVRYPVEASERVVATTSAASGGEQKWLVWRVSGVNDKQKLRVVARSIYEGIGRNELSMQLKTKALASLGGGNSDPDLLDLRPGDTVAVFIRRSRPEEDAATYGDIEAAMTSISSAERFLTELGFPKTFAAAYARSYNGAGFQNYFRVKSMGIDGSAEEGVSIQVECVNYIEARLDHGAEKDPA